MCRIMRESQVVSDLANGKLLLMSLPLLDKSISIPEWHKVV